MSSLEAELFSLAKLFSGTSVCRTSLGEHTLVSLSSLLLLEYGLDSGIRCNHHIAVALLLIARPIFELCFLERLAYAATVANLGQTKTPNPKMSFPNVDLART